LALKPSEIWRKIVTLAKKLYDFKLEPELIKAKSRDGYKNKVALLRDFCLSLGIKITSKNYELSEIKSEEAKDTSKAGLPKGKSSAKQQAALDYESLPFHGNDIAELVPIINHIDISNYDYKTFINSAKAAIREGYFEQAFEFLNQAININLQISGPINKEAATCLSMLANIHYKFGEYMQLLSGEANKESYMFSYSQAIQLQHKAVVLYEKLYGKIHSHTAQAYLSLHKFNNKIGNYTKAFKYLHRALYIYEIVCGENHPEISAIFISLGFMYIDVLGK
jgi:tetratricopeptide (TPR) repeat protein